MQMKKKALRKEMLTKRRGLSAAALRQESAQITEFLCAWPVFTKAETIMIFLSMSDEVQTAKIISKALALGKKVCIPLIGDKPGIMQAARLTSLEDLVPGKFGILTVRPDKLTVIEPSSIDLILVPGVAFAADGRRLGMGAGYYDRFLLRARGAVWAGLCLSCQLTADIPCAEYDLSVEYLITSKGIITCRNLSIPT